MEVFNLKVIAFRSHKFTARTIKRVALENELKHFRLLSPLEGARPGEFNLNFMNPVMTQPAILTGSVMKRFVN